MRELTPFDVLEVAIVSPDLQNIAENNIEIIVDSFLEEGLLKDIPIVGTIVSTIRFSNTINKHLTSKKIFNFLFQLKDISEIKRTKVIEKINNSKRHRNTVGETIFELLDKIENDGKPEILGRLFTLVIEEKLDYSTYLKAAHILKLIFYYDLIALKEAYDGTYVNKHIDDSLLMYGIVRSNMNLVETFNASLRDDKYMQEKDTLTELGKLIVEVGMRE